MLFFRHQNTIVPVKYCKGQHLHRISEITIPRHETNPTFPYSTELQTFLQGRRLLYEQIPFQDETLLEHFNNGYVNFQPGIRQEKHQYICNRCSNKNQSLFAEFYCARCFQVCKYCRNCVTMGRITQCTPLVYWIGPITTFQFKNALFWNGTLSEGQLNASNQVIKAIEKTTNLLVWAVCGAGKTEVLFKGIEIALEEGKYICLATPRTDVVIELAPRLKKVFPEVNVSALYGGSEDTKVLQSLTIATTHQLFKFYNVFDVIIIDEVDAFPFSFDKTLQTAVIQAKKANATTIYLTATPDSKTQKQVMKNQISFVKIPARYHGFPLPVPEFQWCGNWRKQLQKKKIPRQLHLFIQEKLTQKKQVFLFIPTIELLEKLLPLLKKYEKQIEGVYAEDSTRKEKVALFRNGKIPILLTTTILERGVTVPNIDVAVFGADDSVFTESALVQISGRVGRSATYPKGDIIFFHYGKSEAMVRARKQILKMNNLAKDLVKERNNDFV